MPNVDVQKVGSTEDRSLPVFSEFDDLMDRIRVRAYNLFCDRGSTEGADLDDWLAAENEVCWPAAELDEDDDEFEFKVALAGFEPQEISVTASPRELIVKASHDSARKEDEKADVKWSEFRSNNVYRRVQLPADIDLDKVEAKYKNGLLEIDAPKAAEKKGRSKKIKVASSK